MGRPARKTATPKTKKSNIPEDISEDELPPENETDLLNAVNNRSEEEYESDETTASEDGEISSDEDEDDAELFGSSSEEEEVAPKKAAPKKGKTTVPKTTPSKATPKGKTTPPKVAAITPKAAKAEKPVLTFSVTNIEGQNGSGNLSKAVVNDTAMANGATRLQAAKAVFGKMANGKQCSYAFSLSQEGDTKAFTYIGSVDEDGKVTVKAGQAAKKTTSTPLKVDKGVAVKTTTPKGKAKAKVVEEVQEDEEPIVPAKKVDKKTPPSTKTSTNFVGSNTSLATSTPKKPAAKGRGRPVASKPVTTKVVDDDESPEEPAPISKGVKAASKVATASKVAVKKAVPVKKVATPAPKGRGKAVPKK